MEGSRTGGSVPRFAGSLRRRSHLPRGRRVEPGRLYPEGTVRRFENIRNKLLRNKTEDLTLVGNAYEVPQV